MPEPEADKSEGGLPRAPKRRLVRCRTRGPQISGRPSRLPAREVRRNSKLPLYESLRGAMYLPARPPPSRRGRGVCDPTLRARAWEERRRSRPPRAGGGMI